MSKTVRKIVNTSQAVASVAALSEAVQVGNMLYCSGVLGLDKEVMQLVQGGIKAQTRQAFINLKNTLEAAGSSFDKVVKMTVLLQDMNDFKDVNELYAQHFKKPYPARTTYQAGKLPLGAMIEMEAIAIVGEVETTE